MTLTDGMKKDLENRGYSAVRTETIIETMAQVLTENPYVEKVRVDCQEITVVLKPLETDYVGTFDLNINKREPNISNPFVPTYHTVQVDLVTSKGIENKKEHPLYTVLNARRPFADNNLGEYFYSFGTYLDEGGEENAKRVAEAVSTEISKHIGNWFEFVERERREFKKLLK